MIDSVSKGVMMTEDGGVLGLSGYISNISLKMLR